jgi:ABC-type Fe3+ transport system permease subunit
MASTGGGFLLGFGLCLLVFSLLSIVGVEEAYSELVKYRSDIETLYSITHSSEYQSVLSDLKTISSYVSKISEALCNPGILFMGLCDIGKRLESSISGAANNMEEVKSSSEELYNAMNALPAVEDTLWKASIAGFIIMVIGIALISRARRKEKAVKT